MWFLTNKSAHELADGYTQAPDEFDNIPYFYLKELRLIVARMFEQIAQKVYFEFVDYEPYGQNPKLKDMLEDFEAGCIRIHTTGNDSKVWGKFCNLEFRAIHDYLHCLYKLDFTHENELAVYAIQAGASWPFLNECSDYTKDLYFKILRSEIVYQSAYKEVNGEFHIDQKIILTDL